MDYYNVSLHGFFYEFFLLFFFQNSLCRFCFVVFFFKTLWIVIIFLHIVFVLLQCFLTCFFLNNLCRIFFNIELVENSVLIFPTCFFPIFLLFFYCFFFQNCLLLFFCVFFRIVFFLFF